MESIDSRQYLNYHQNTLTGTKKGAIKMAGYDYYAGMSNNAVYAYEEGRKPLSQFTKNDLKSQNIDLSLSFVKFLAKQNIWTTYEWHHCSSAFNEVKFYDLEVLKDTLADLSKEELAQHQADYKNFKKSKLTKNNEEKKVEGKYTTFYKFGRRWKPSEHTFTGVKKGNWIFLDGGGKKKADGNNIYYSFI